MKRKLKIREKKLSGEEKKNENDYERFVKKTINNTQ